MTFLLGAGAFVAGALWLGLVVFPRRAEPIERLLAYGRSRGFVSHGDGVATPLRLVRAYNQRICTLTFQIDGEVGDTLILGVDCEADAGAGPEAAVLQDAALVVRWLRPDRALFEAERLDAALRALVEAAEALEARGDPPGATDEPVSRTD